VKFASKAHLAFAKIAAEHPGQSFTAVQMSAIEAAGFDGAMSDVIPGDHAIKPDGRPANEYTIVAD